MGARHDVLFHTVIPFSLGAVSLTFFCLGAYALIHRRPFAIRARWLLIVMALLYLPWLAMHIEMGLDLMSWRADGSARLVAIVGPLMILVVLAFFTVATRGYLVFSVTQDSFRNALVAALNRLGVPFEERLSNIRLPTIPAELHAAVQGWLGTGQLRIKGKQQSRVLTNIAQAMNAEFASGHVETNMATAIFNVLMGLLMAVLVFALVSVA